MKTGQIVLIVWLGILFIPPIVREIYYFLLCNKKINQTILFSNRISIEKVEHSISFYSKKAKSLEYKLYGESDFLAKYQEEEVEMFYWEHEYLKSKGKIEKTNLNEKELESLNKFREIKNNKNREFIFKKLFSPD
jgi:hypothetical protein